MRPLCSTENSELHITHIDVYNNWILRWVARNRHKTVCRLPLPFTPCWQQQGVLVCSLIGLLFVYPTPIMTWACEQTDGRLMSSILYRKMLLLYSSCILSVPQVRWTGQKWKDDQSHHLNVNVNTYNTLFTSMYSSLWK